MTQIQRKHKYQCNMIGPNLFNELNDFYIFKWNLIGKLKNNYTLSLVDGVL